MTTIEKIINYFENDENALNSCIEELDGYNGYLGDDRYYPMSDLNEIYHDCDPSEILARAFYGYDEDNYSTDSHGNKTYSAFNPNRDYFKFNGYGNLVSTDYIDYSAYLDEYFINALAENRAHISAIDWDDELSALFDELEEE